MSELNQQEVNMEVILSTEQSFDVIIVTEEEMELLFEKYIGDDGKSAYELAVEYGYEGTEEEFATYQAHAAEYAEEAKDARDTILNMSASATELPSGSAPTAQWDSETGIMLFGIPKGPKGDPGDDAPQIDDTAPSTEHPYSSAKVEEKLATINQAIGTLPTSETGSEWANKEELNTELVGQFVGEVDRMFSTGLPQKSTMGRLILELSKSNGLLNDLYIGMESEGA